MKKSEYERLDGSLASFELIRKRSEKYWETVELMACWGFQIQPGSKWKKGLSEAKLTDFQNQVGFKFPDSLKNYFRTMNGLDKPGLNNNGGEDETDYGSTFYTYPDDVETIKSHIQWILEANNISPEVFSSGNIPNIFPYYGHRFLIMEKTEFVLSMYGNDIIYWADNLAKGIVNDIFGFLFEFTHSAYNSVRNRTYSEIRFWGEKIQ